MRQTLIPSIPLPERFLRGIKRGIQRAVWRRASPIAPDSNGSQRNGAASPQRYKRLRMMRLSLFLPLYRRFRN